MLNAQWSPQQISARLTVDYPDDPEEGDRNLVGN